MSSKRKYEPRRSSNQREAFNIWWVAGIIGAIVVVGIVATVVLGDSPRQAAQPRAITSADQVQRIAPVEAKALLDSENGVLYDTRSAEAYRAGHAGSAISLPEEEVAARYDELPEDKALIFY